MSHNEVYLTSIKVDMQQLAHQFNPYNTVSFSPFCLPKQSLVEGRRHFQKRENMSIETASNGNHQSRGSHACSSEWDVSRLIDQNDVNSRLDTVPDSQMARSFATAIDDIIKGRRPGRRGRTRARMDKAKVRSERKATRPEKPSVSCDKCGSTFASVGNLNRHRRVSHQGLRVYCDFPGCHQVSFHPFSERPIECCCVSTMTDRIVRFIIVGSGLT